MHPTMNENFRPAARRHPAGFTLVELLVVIAIIAVLGALTTVGVRGMMSKAHESTCAGNMRQLGVALASFTADKGRYPSPTSASPMPQPPDPAHWDRMLLPYLADPNFDFTEGVNNAIREGTAEAAALGAAAKILKCPADDVKPGNNEFKRSYAMCNWTINQSSRSPGNPGGWSNAFKASGVDRQPVNTGVKPIWVTEPHRAVVMTEFWAPKDSQYKHVIGSANYSLMYGYRPMPQDSQPAYYHKKNENILFADGHVESIPGNLPRDSSSPEKDSWNKRGYDPANPPQ